MIDQEGQKVRLSRYLFDILVVVLAISILVFAAIAEASGWSELKSFAYASVVWAVGGAIVFYLSSKSKG